MIRLEKELESRGLKQAQAARLPGISQPRVAALLRGRVELFSSCRPLPDDRELGNLTLGLLAAHDRIEASAGGFTGSGAAAGAQGLNAINIQI